MRFAVVANLKVIFTVLLGLAAVHARALPAQDATETAAAPDAEHSELVWL
ncbi:hypothetical protein PYCCODRAFT_1480490 [Trametes coccinea BRFM310]|uniref:Uncharacterized protein n=1 Tax=Trametes coccinea (strain BRFM310) TaxID=1353009 RepID=A0A1Y2IBR4_TRAC3|nr:hypothetical protein PYCCODRAFT_1480490 [Trametes coccinea BRFM310]